MTDIEDIIRQEFDEFLYKDGRQPSKLHLPIEVGSEVPYCHYMIPDDHSFRRKAVEVYPRGFREICLNCIGIWKETVNNQEKTQ